MRTSPTPKTARATRTSATRASAPASHSLLRRRAVEGRRAVSGLGGATALEGPGRAELARAPRPRRVLVDIKHLYFHMKRKPTLAAGVSFLQLYGRGFVVDQAGRPPACGAKLSYALCGATIMP